MLPRHARLIVPLFLEELRAYGHRDSGFIASVDDPPAKSPMLTGARSFGYPSNYPEIVLIFLLRLRRGLCGDAIHARMREDQE
jgi:hypothetical protein